MHLATPTKPTLAEAQEQARAEFERGYHFILIRTKDGIQTLETYQAVKIENPEEKE